MHYVTFLGADVDFIAENVLTGGRFVSMSQATSASELGQILNAEWRRQHYRQEDAPDFLIGGLYQPVR